MFSEMRLREVGGRGVETVPWLTESAIYAQGHIFHTTEGQIRLCVRLNSPSH